MSWLHRRSKSLGSAPIPTSNDSPIIRLLPRMPEFSAGTAIIVMRHALTDANAFDGVNCFGRGRLVEALEKIEIAVNVRTPGKKLGCILNSPHQKGRVTAKFAAQQFAPMKLPVLEQPGLEAALDSNPLIVADQLHELFDDSGAMLLITHGENIRYAFSLTKQVSSLEQHMGFGSVFLYDPTAKKFELLHHGTPG